MGGRMWNTLIVDDDFVNRKLLTEVLKDFAESVTASGGKEAIESYELSLKNGRPYDLILLDIAMPEVNGLEVLKYIRSNEAKMSVAPGRGVCIIMITAFRDPFAEAFGLGCDDYVLKPVMPDLLIQKIQQKIDRKIASGDNV